MIFAVVAMITIGLLGSALAGPAAADDQGSGAATGLEWGDCPAEVVTGALPYRLTCAKVPVPLDYGDPDGTKIEIMISRLASENPAKRRGVLMLNPGGPGGSGLTLSTLLASRGIPASVLDSYDLIGMDTRGVGHSAPVSCGFTPDDAYFMNVPPYAPDKAAVAAQAKIAKEVAERCAKNDRDGRLKHLTTANTARDLDQIRAALGEEKTNFLGFSYGTALGSAYVSLFPERAARIVLDSNLADSHLDRPTLRRFALGMEQTFPDFAKWAAKRDGSYGLGRTPDQVRKTYFELAEQLDETPVAGMSGALFRMATFGSLYGQQQYPVLAQQWQALGELLNGTEAERKAAPSAKPADLSPTDNALTVFLAVTCNDVEWPEDVATYQRAVAEDRRRHPLFGAAAANISPCAFWSHDAAGPVKISDDGERNVLLLQNLRDPVTPPANAELLRDKLGDRARLVSVDGSGHGVYGLSGHNPCALAATTDYLVDGTMPRRDTYCRAS
ncbi:alpha/beta hydrolase [Microlunatus speluncae]|uniref:alpha/beta hydrolase n=1 Tax=Microlunatus speluncae TaxID=2594267 RepID=UPI001C2CD97E|nr:alpha/beta hydrolase [Microlunatus speluncae]